MLWSSLCCLALAALTLPLLGVGQEDMTAASTESSEAAALDETVAESSTITTTEILTTTEDSETTHSTAGDSTGLTTTEESTGTTTAEETTETTTTERPTGTTTTEEPTETTTTEEPTEATTTEEPTETTTTEEPTEATTTEEPTETTTTEEPTETTTTEEPTETTTNEEPTETSASEPTETTTNEEPIETTINEETTETTTSEEPTETTTTTTTATIEGIADAVQDAQTFSVHAGFISEGDDLLRVKMTVHEAKHWCEEAMGRCAGFSHEGPPTDEAVDIVIKSAWGIEVDEHQLWTSYKYEAALTAAEIALARDSTTTTTEPVELPWIPDLPDDITDQHIEDWYAAEAESLDRAGFRERYERGAWMYGDHRNEILHVRHALRCAEACEDEARCRHWNFNVVTRKCALKKHGRGSVDNSRFDWICGHGSRHLKADDPDTDL